MQTGNKRSYTTPSLTSYGTISKLTQGTSADGGGGGGGTINGQVQGPGVMVIVML